MKLTAVLLGVVFSASAQAALQVPAASCDAALAAAIQSDMTLSEPDFDQAEHTGFRALARKGCQAEAGVLALAYLGRNPGTSPNVWWHAAQLFAGAGRMEVADALATFALSGRETDATPFRWNDYVLASKAYFARDPDQFALYTAKIRQKVACQVGNAINLNMLEALQTSWDAGYDAAGAHAVDTLDARVQALMADCPPPG